MLLHFLQNLQPSNDNNQTNFFRNFFNSLIQAPRLLTKNQINLLLNQQIPYPIRSMNYKFEDRRNPSFSRNISIEREAFLNPNMDVFQLESTIKNNL